MRQDFKHVPKNMCIPVSKFPWIPRTNTCNVIFIGILVLLRIPQRANIDNCSGFRKLGEFPKCRWILHAHEEYADNLRIQLTICGIRLQLTDSAYTLQISLKFTGSAEAQIFFTHKFLFVQGFHKLCRGFRKVASFLSDFEED